MNVAKAALLLSPLCLLCGCLGSPDKQPPKKLNLLFVIVDDLRTTLGCYGDPVVKTPNMDQLASRSVLFNATFAQQAVCAPSRTSMLTSRRPDSTRLYDFGSYWRHSAGNYTTLPQLLRNRGWLTASVGKVFHPGIASNYTDDYPYSWSIPAYHPPTQKYKNAKVCVGPAGGRPQADVVCPVEVSSTPGGTLPDVETRREAQRLLAEFASRPQQPFMLAVGFHKPHIPLKYPKEFLSLYPPGSVGPAPERGIPVGMPPVAWNPWVDVRKRHDVASLNLSFPYGDMPLPFQVEVRRSYLAAVTYVDRELGHVLASLDSLGLADSTAVVLTSDHGWSLGEHGEWAKYSLFEVSTRVPLLISVPGVTTPLLGVATPPKPSFPFIDPLGKEGLPHTPPPGRVSQELVELVDVFPTLVELLGMPAMPPCPSPSFHVDLCTEGRSRAASVKGSKPSLSAQQDEENVAYSQYPRPGLEPGPDSDLPPLSKIRVMGYSARSARYRYTEWVPFDPRGFRPDFSRPLAREFYELAHDPGEDRNRADGGGGGGRVELEIEEERQAAMKRLSAGLARKFGGVK